jgi:hypothetical protein
MNVIVVLNNGVSNQNEWLKKKCDTNNNVTKRSVHDYKGGLL